MEADPKWTPLRTACEERGIKMTWLARQLKVSHTYLSLISSGDRKPPKAFFERAAGILNVPVESVLPKEPAAA